MTPRPNVLGSSNKKLFVTVSKSCIPKNLFSFTIQNRKNWKLLYCGWHSLVYFCTWSDGPVGTELCSPVSARLGGAQLGTLHVARPYLSFDFRSFYFYFVSSPQANVRTQRILSVNESVHAIWNFLEASESLWRNNNPSMQKHIFSHQSKYGYRRSEVSFWGFKLQLISVTNVSCWY